MGQPSQPTCTYYHNSLMHCNFLYDLLTSLRVMFLDILIPTCIPSFLWLSKPKTKLQHNWDGYTFKYTYIWTYRLTDFDISFHRDLNAPRIEVPLQICDSLQHPLFDPLMQPFPAAYSTPLSSGSPYLNLQSHHPIRNVPKLCLQVTNTIIAFITTESSVDGNEYSTDVDFLASKKPPYPVPVWSSPLKLQEPYEMGP